MMIVFAHDFRLNSRVTQTCRPTIGGKTETTLPCAPFISTWLTERKAKTMNANEKENVKLAIELTIEEIEEMIAPGPGLVLQHNETLEVDLTVEEVEEVIAPGPILQHNETLVKD
jgi:hypothetical protein